MRHQSHSHSARVPIHAGRQVAQLRHVLRLVEELAGRPPEPGVADAALDEGARIASLYDEAEPIVQRRFDILAAETAAWSAAGVEALLAAGDERSPAAIRRLADELEKSLSDLVRMLRPPAAPPVSRATPSP
jgi:hypothetical protein